jgi:ketosteroid isomerase-like protein
MEQYERVTIESTAFWEAGDTVLASVTQHGTGVASGIDLSLPYFIAMTFRAGKIVLGRPSAVSHGVSRRVTA